MRPSVGRVTSLLDPPPLAPRLARWRRLVRQVRRRVLAHRRLLAALLVGVAVAAALRALSPPPPATTAVTVAARDLPAGATLGSGDVTVERWPEASLPDGAVDSPVGEVLASPVRRGEPLTDARLVGQAAAAAPAGSVAAPVRLPDASAVALLRPGDRIDLVATDARRGRTELVAAGVLVLTVPPVDPGASAAGPLGGRIVVLALPASSVENVLSAAVRLFLTYSYAV